MDRILDSGSNDWGSTPHGCTKQQKRACRKKTYRHALFLSLSELLSPKVAIYRNIFYLCSVESVYTMRKFKTIFLDEAVEFLDSLTEQARDKIFYNIFKVEGGVKSNDLFKKLEGTDIWEFRTLYNGIQYRLFAFWDTENETLVVATHGIIKKVWKVPSKEIAKAEEIRKQYFETK